MSDIRSSNISSIFMFGKQLVVRHNSRPQSQSGTALSARVLSPAPPARTPPRQCVQIDSNRRRLSSLSKQRHKVVYDLLIAECLEGERERGLILHPLVHSFGTLGVAGFYRLTTVVMMSVLRDFYSS
ncbi:hypothetical protein EVAR_4105_1 [Eumeta japonica]|uniref:Uncharacterized protein n=1 Tax=Eumeta variegata TaxID=151549 RepID=A0A4C1T500_EUMVA|nr:hypothetical protein EVAR_4105_1 [Eumeta japonica]